MTHAHKSRSTAAGGDRFDRAALQALHRLSQAMVAAPSLTAVCERILREAVRVIPVARASIMQYDATDGTLRVVASVGIPARVAKSVRVPVGVGVSGHVFASSKPLLVRDVRRFPQASRRKRYRGQSIIAAPVTGAPTTTMPLEVAGRPLGVINMTDRRDGRAFTARDLALLQTLANQAAAYMRLCALADEVTRQRQLDQELTIARDIQQGLLPSGPSRFPGITVTGRCWPADRVGGDYFDCFADAAGLPTVVIADVAGHDVASALTMAGLRSGLRAEMARDGQSLGTVMERVNRQLFADLVRAERFISCLLLRYDRPARVIRYCVAGHPSPLLLKKRGPQVSTLPAADGCPLGVHARAVFTEQVVPVARGDVLVLYTDGLSGARNSGGATFGEARLRRALRAHRHLSPSVLPGAVHQDLRAFTGLHPFDDDVTLVAIRIL